VDGVARTRSARRDLESVGDSPMDAAHGRHLFHKASCRCIARLRTSPSPRHTLQSVSAKSPSTTSRSKGASKAAAGSTQRQRIPPMHHLALHAASSGNWLRQPFAQAVPRLIRITAAPCGWSGTAPASGPGILGPCAARPQVSRLMQKSPLC
jgi:hypothetical protein